MITLIAAAAATVPAGVYLRRAVTPVRIAFSVGVATGRWASKQQQRHHPRERTPVA